VKNSDKKCLERKEKKKAERKIEDIYTQKISKIFLCNQFLEISKLIMTHIFQIDL
jgi:hypothetical protein